MPEIAARAHLAHLPRLVARVLDEAGLGAARARRRRRHRRAGADRRADRRRQLRQGDRARARAALPRDQPPGGACADRRGCPIVAPEGLAFPICSCCSRAGIANAWRWRAWGGTVASAARWTMRWARLRQIGQAARPALAGRAASGAAGRAAATRGRRSPAPAAARPARLRLLLQRAEDGGGAGGGGAASARRTGQGRPGRRLPGLGRRRAGRPRGARAGDAARGDARWWSPAASPRTARCAPRWPASPRRRAAAGRAAGPAVHRQCGDGRLGRRERLRLGCPIAWTMRRGRAGRWRRWPPTSRTSRRGSEAGSRRETVLGRTTLRQQRIRRRTSPLPRGAWPATPLLRSRSTTTSRPCRIAGAAPSRSCCSPRRWRGARRWSA